MRRRSGKFNPKRRICAPTLAQVRLAALQPILARLHYGGNPEHKRNPGDFGLNPPCQPRPSKTLCDQVKIFTRTEAISLLREGLLRGVFSVQERNGWPQNVWSVTKSGEPLEAQLEGDGVYHGYPMPADDPFREEVIQRWNSK
ncbi:MAG: hypothetical protein IPJ98_30705 [Bryobacterales bacterium]|nr:hypothetical protein [Bryobacterales bacterium]